MTRRDVDRLHDIQATIDNTLLDQAPLIPWVDVARMRDRLAHRYFDTSHAIVQGTVDHDLPLSEGSLRTLMNAADQSGSPLGAAQAGP